MFSLLRSINVFPICLLLASQCMFNLFKIAKRLEYCAMKCSVVLGLSTGFNR